VRPSLRDALDKIKYDFEACPLAVYVDDRFIPPVDVQNLLKGALVEVQFELRHFSIAKKKEDSYNATIKQVLVLQPGRERPPNAFKRRNLFDGPVRLNPTLVSAKEAEDWARAHNILAYVETSAKSGEGVERAFREVAERIWQGIEAGRYNLEDRRSGVKRAGAGGGGTVKMNAGLDDARSRGIGGGCC